GFNYCFQDCGSLTAIPASLFDNCTNVTGFNSCFYYCSSLTAIPAGLFDNCPNVTGFNSCFNSCSSLTAIPAGLFDNCTNVTSFNYCFYYCYNLVLRGDEFALPTLKDRTINFGNCFQAQSTSPTYQKVGTAPELWNADLSTSSTTTRCFGNRTLLTNYSSIPSAWL
ncbi:MAG: hypothetical protein PHV15_15295, partial [Thomasclavelia ramosa]|nr:hypothetical protein [Thomasclavelia ramosa]